MNVSNGLFFLSCPLVIPLFSRTFYSPAACPLPGFVPPPYASAAAKSRPVSGTDQAFLVISD